MRRFIIKLIPYLLFVSMFMFMAYCVDPYNVMHWYNIRNNGVQPNKNYIKTKYIISEPHKFDGYLFGSSRVGAIHTERIPGKMVYNMTYPVGLPREHLNNIQSFIESGVDIDTIYVGVDSMSYTYSPEAHSGTPMQASYEELQNIDTFFLTYFNLKTTIKSIAHIIEHSQDIDVDSFYKYGWIYGYDIKTEYDWSNAEATVGIVNLMDETLQDIKNMVDLCNKENIKLVIFTNPMCEITHRASVEKEYYIFLEKLAQITDYYNFSGLNDITTNIDNFYDSSHYSAEVGDMIIDSILVNTRDKDLYEQGFGWYVTKENVEELVGILESNDL